MTTHSQEEVEQGDAKLEQEEVDPQYFWILPKHLETTSRTKEFSPSVLFLDGQSLQQTETGTIYFLSRLCSKLGGMGEYGWWVIPDSVPGGLTAFGQQKERFCEEHGLVVPSTCNYMIRSEVFKAIRHVGLDIRGGFIRFWNIWEQCKGHGEVFPMSSVLIDDPEKARKYINIGVNLSTDIPKNPSTLGDAVSAYNTLMKLVGDSMTVKDVQRKIDESVHEGSIWELKREKFRIETKERYREMLIDIAHEERLQNQLDNIWGKKRARLDGA